MKEASNNKKEAAFILVDRAVQAFLDQGYRMQDIVGTVIAFKEEATRSYPF